MDRKIAPVEVAGSVIMVIFEEIIKICDIYIYVMLFHCLRHNYTCAQCYASYVCVSSCHMIYEHLHNSQ